MARRILETWRGAWAYAALASAAGWAHLFEVHALDALGRRAAETWVGPSFAPFMAWEAPLVRALDAMGPRATSVVAAYYLGAFLLLLAAAPLLVAATGDGRLLRRTLLCYPLAYLLALPWLLFFPSVNPYTHAGAAGPFDGIHPRLEDVYYLLTTRDNTFPSLHVALTVVLAANAMRVRVGAAKLAFLVHAALLAASVVALRVHYVADVAGGLALAWLTLRLADACLARRGPLAGVGRALDRACAPARAREASGSGPRAS